MIYGWDGASYQGLPDCAQMRRDGHDFCIEKVTGEGSYVNPVWSTVRDRCRAAGVIFGSYDWVMPQEWRNPADANTGAHNYLDTLGAIQNGELLTVDFEEPKWYTGPLGRNIEAAMKAYLYALRDASGFRAVIIYTAPYFLTETRADKWAWLTEANGFYLWQAAPGGGMMADDSFWPATPKPFTTTLLHQHQWYATGKGIVGQFDRDRFQGTREELMAYGYQGGDVGNKTNLNKEGDVKEPAAGKWFPYINDKGESLIVMNLGGKTKRIVGAVIGDAGVTVDSDTEPGVTVSMSFRANEFTGYGENRGGDDPAGIIAGGLR